MKKRSAMAIAAGLIAALLTGAVALSLGLTTPQTADASGTRDPRVRTVHRTVTIHREAKAKEPKTVTIVTAGASSPTGASVAGGVQSAPFEDESEGEDGFEDEGGYEDAEDHEDGYEDHGDDD